MLGEKVQLWDDNQNVSYTKYLTDNSYEIDINRQRPAMIVCGGGAYLRISDREKEPVALFFLNQGYQVFVLDYTTNATGDARYPNPVYDLAKMVSVIRQNATAWKIHPDKIAAVGFSAGGHLCACLATQWHQTYLCEKLSVQSEMIKLNAAVLCYPLLDYIYSKMMLDKDPEKDLPPVTMPETKNEIMKKVVKLAVGDNATDEQLKNASPYYHVSEKTSPLFIWHTADDELVYAGQSMRFALKLEEHKVPYELHVYQSGVHGLSLANKQTTGKSQFINDDVSGWVQLASRFLSRLFDL